MAHALRFVVVHNDKSAASLDGMPCTDYSAVEEFEKTPLMPSTYLMEYEKLDYRPHSVSS